MPRKPKKSSEGKSGSMLVTIRSVSGETFSLRTKPTDTTADLKAKIEKKENLAQSKQRLLFVGSLLQEQRTLEDAKVTSGSIIDLLKQGDRGWKTYDDIEYWQNTTEHAMKPTPLRQYIKAKLNRRIAENRESDKNGKGENTVPDKIALDAVLIALELLENFATTVMGNTKLIASRSKRDTVRVNDLIIAVEHISPTIAQMVIESAEQTELRQEEEHKSRAQRSATYGGKREKALAGNRKKRKSGGKNKG